MNNLTLYLLLAADQAEQSASVDGRTVGEVEILPANVKPKAARTGIYQPRQYGPQTLRQASYRPANGTHRRTGDVRTLAFSATVVANAMGFLALASGTLLLLQIAQVILS